MFCPNCGKKNSHNQNFCRACGLGLEKIAQSLVEQLPSASDRTLQERKERLERFGMASLSVFGAGLILFVLYNIFAKLTITQGTFNAILAVLAAIIFLGSGLASVILFAKAKELKEVSARNRTELPDEPAANQTDRILESREQTPFSITERTTNLLENKSKRNEPR